MRELVNFKEDNDRVLSINKILWLGDFYYDYDYMSSDIDNLAKWIKEKEYSVILNLEGGIHSGKYNKIVKRGPNLYSNTIAIDVLKKLNVIGVCLANNHIMDFGNEGLSETIKILDNNNIMHTGAGRNIKEALKEMVFDLNGKSIAVINFGWNIEETVNATFEKPGCSPRNKEIILKKIEEIKSQYDKIVVSIHWGFEYNRYPMPYDIELAHAIIDQGVSLIIGHHSHCVQSKEIYHNVPIYYSLGNFYFSGIRDQFNKKFNEKIKNQSDYGIGISYDFSRELNEYQIKYDRSTRESIINKKITDDILVDITNTNYNSKYYYKKIKKNKNNFNPILTINDKKNKCLLKKLFIKYRIRNLAKKILKRR